MSGSKGDELTPSVPFSSIMSSSASWKTSSSETEGRLAGSMLRSLKASSVDLFGRRGLRGAEEVEDGRRGTLEVEEEEELEVATGLVFFPLDRMFALSSDDLDLSGKSLGFWISQ